MGLIEMDRTRAEDFMKAIEKFFIAKGVDIKYVRFMGFDGCSTMSGTHNGLQRRMTNASPFAEYLSDSLSDMSLFLMHLITFMQNLSNRKYLVFDTLWSGGILLH